MTSPAQRLDETYTGLTPAKTLLLVGFATFAWFCAANYIRIGGALGDFRGMRGIITYAVTIPVTIPLNWLTRKIVGLPPQQMVTAVAVTSATAVLLDGLALAHFPKLYGGDPVVMLGGAAWLLWAIGVAGALSLATSTIARRKS